MKEILTRDHKRKRSGEGSLDGRQNQEILRLLLKLLINIDSRAVVLVISFKNPMLPRAYAYALLRDVARNSLELKTWNWYSSRESIFGLNTSRWMERARLS